MAVDVLTYHNDNARDGANLHETTLTPANVNANTFGKLGSVSVDGDVYAQPLIKTNVMVPGKGRQNLVFVATENDSLYAFNADTLAPVWHDNFTNPAAGITPMPTTTSDIYPTIGITSTPVIDPKTNTLYLVDTVEETTAAGPSIIQQLRAIDIRTGAEKFGGPVTLNATYTGVGTGNTNGVLTYIAAIENQRSALLLNKGTISIASSSFSSEGPYHGWLLDYSARTLKQTGVFVDTPNGVMGGTWMSGGGPAADAQGNIYYSTGNGTFNSQTADFADSVVKLAPGGKTLTDFFAPADQATLQAEDKDFGSGGVVLLPNQPGPNKQELVAAGKEGTIYLLNRNNLGKNSNTANNVVEQLPSAIPYSFDTPAFFNNTLYYVGGPSHGPSMNGDAPVLQAFSLSNGLINPKPVNGTVDYGWPGATPSVSANGNTNGIVWTLDGSDFSTAPPTLRAYNAANVSQELYASTQAGTRDLAAGSYNKFTPPTVANGKVYVAAKGALTLYGLLPPG